MIVYEVFGYELEFWVREWIEEVYMVSYEDFKKVLFNVFFVVWMGEMMLYFNVIVCCGVLF